MRHRAEASGLGPRALICVALASCSREPEIASCRDSIAGMWREAGGRVWAVIDRGPRIEAFPDWADAEVKDGIEIAPRVIDLARNGDAISGAVHRRYMKGAAGCDAAVPIRVRACRGTTLEIELADPPPPVAYAPKCEMPTIDRPPVTTWTWLRSGP